MTHAKKCFFGALCIATDIQFKYYHNILHFKYYHNILHFIGNQVSPAGLVSVNECGKFSVFNKLPP